jgi:hypothetical protein
MFHPDTITTEKFEARYHTWSVDVHYADSNFYPEIVCPVLTVGETMDKRNGKSDLKTWCDQFRTIYME